MPSTAYFSVPFSCRTDSTFVVLLKSQNETATNRGGNPTIFNTQLYGYFLSLEMLDCPRAILDAESSIPVPVVPDDPTIHPWTNLELQIPVTPNPPTTYWIVTCSTIGSASFGRSSVPQTLAKEPTSRLVMGLLSRYSFLRDAVPNSCPQADSKPTRQDSETWVDSRPLTINALFNDFSVILASWRNAITHNTWKCSDPLDFGRSSSCFDTFTTYQGSVIKAASPSAFPTEAFSAPASLNLAFGILDGTI